MNDPTAVPRLLHEDATERLRDMIVQGELAPGAKLTERVLCERLGVSRTPLREAIKRLVAEGLVELQPNRGATVKALTLETLRETFQVMGALEALAGELACARASGAELAELRALTFQMRAHHARGDLPAYFRDNQRIHLLIVECSGNATLAATYRTLNANVRRARYMANLTRERWDQAVREHDEILDALERRDAPRLKALLSEHLGNKMLAAIAATEAAGAPVAAYD